MNKKSYLERAEYWINSGKRERAELISAINRSQEQLELPNIDKIVSEDIQSTITFLKCTLSNDDRITQINESIDLELPKSESNLDLSSLGDKETEIISKVEQKKIFKTLLDSGAVSKGIPETFKNRDQ